MTAGWVRVILRPHGMRQARRGGGHSLTARDQPGDAGRGGHSEAARESEVACAPGLAAEISKRENRHRILMPVQSHRTERVWTSMRTRQRSSILRFFGRDTILHSASTSYAASEVQDRPGSALIPTNAPHLTDQRGVALWLPAAVIAAAIQQVNFLTVGMSRNSLGPWALL